MLGFFKSLLGEKTAKVAEVLPFGSRFEVPAGQTLLESALAHQVPFPHDCTVGTCGSCKCRLKEGRVKAITDFGYTLSKEELDAGYILACQAVPRDALTVVEVEAPVPGAPQPETFNGRIASREALTHDIERVTIRLDRPVRFIAGQYASIGGAGMARGRSYSFANAPAAEGSRDISLFIRKTPGGVFTEALFKGELDEVSLNVEAPHGLFHLRAGDAPMICIAGGSGLAPLLSLLADACASRVRRRCVLLFGARSQADLYALDEIRTIAAAWPLGLEFVPVLSDEPADSNWTGARGLVTEFIATSLPGIDWRQAQGYMCGPPRMIDAGVSALSELGVPLESIHYDKFTDASFAATAG